MAHTTLATDAANPAFSELTFDSPHESTDDNSLSIDIVDPIDEEAPPKAKRRPGRPRKPEAEKAVNKRRAQKQQLRPAAPEPENDDAEDDASTYDNTAADPEHELALKEDIFYWLDNLSDEMWSGLTVYVYRKEPVWLQDKTGGKPHFIQKMSMRFNADDLKRMHGSGIYRMDVTSALNVGGSRRLKKGDVHILDPNYPPNLPVSDAWTKNPINAKWFWSIPILERREGANNSQARSNSQPPTIPGTPAATEDDGLVGLARRSQEQLMELSDPKRQLATIQQIIEMVKPTAPADSGNNAMMMMMFNMVQEQNKELREELKDIRKQRTAEPPKDARTVLLETLEIAETLGFKRGNSQKSDPWAGFLEKIVDSAPLIAEIFVNGPQPPQPQQAPQIAAGPTPQPQQAETQAEEENEPTMSPQEQQQAAMMAALEPIIKNSIGPMIEAVKAGTPDALKRFILDEYGRKNFESLKSNIGAERMAHLATTHPLLRTQLPAKPEMQRFFDEVFK